MCRNIRKLRRPDGGPSDQELVDASLQFVRKISGYRVPSKANREAFDRAVTDIAAVARELFASLRIRPAAESARPEPASTPASGR